MKNQYELSIGLFIFTTLILATCSKKIEHESNSEPAVRNDPKFYLHSRDIVLNEEQQAFLTQVST